MPLSLVELCTIARLEMTYASSPYLSLDLGAEQAVSFLGVLQLVARRPDLPPAIAELVLQLAETIECELAALGPATRELCRLGWNVFHDELPS